MQRYQEKYSNLSLIKKEDCSNVIESILQMFLHHFQSFASFPPLLWFRLIALKSPQIRQTPLNLQNPLSPLPLQPKPFTFTQILNHPDTSKISFHFGSALLNFNLQTAIIFNFWGTPIHQFSEKFLSHNSFPMTIMTTCWWTIQNRVWYIPTPAMYPSQAESECIKSNTIWGSKMHNSKRAT